MKLTLPKNTPLFHGMTDSEIENCLTALEEAQRSYKKGTILLHAGSRTCQMGLVLSGSVTIENNDLWGNCTVLSLLTAGQPFAETYALLPNEVLLVDVRANEDCSVLFLRIDGLFDRLPYSSWKEKLTQNLLLISAHKNLTLSSRSFHTSSKSARGRLLSYLNAVSLQSGSDSFDIPYDRQQLADYLGLERTNMSKELTRMKEDGILECRKNHFRLLRPEFEHS